MPARATRRARRPTIRRSASPPGLAEIAALLGVDLASFVAADRADRARHDGDHERRAHRAAAHDRPARDEGLPRRARAAQRRCARRRTTTACSRRRRSCRATCGSASTSASTAPASRGDPALAEDDVRAAVRALPRRGRRGRRDLVHALARGRRRTSARARDLCRELLPDAYVTASSDLLPQVRYYDRTSTTVLNAYVGPIITPLPRRADGAPGRARLRRRAADHAVERRRRDARRGRPSGPRSRCSRGRRRARRPGSAQLAPHGLADCITIDMGGTSFDAALVKDGEPLVMTDGDRRPLADRAADDRHPHDRRRRRLDRAGRRGRHAAGRARRAPGAEPGPACYGRGGTAADDDRRRPRARLPRPGELPAAAACRLDRDARGARDRGARRRAARALARAGGRRHLRRRQRDDGDRRARGERAPRPRPARVPARRRGRRRAGPRRCDRARARDPAARRPARVVDLLRRRAC